MGRVYIVHCVDTEGPLYEDFSVPFEQIKNIYGIKIEPTDENLKKIKEGKLDLKGNERSIQNLVDKHKSPTKGNWDEIENMLCKITSDGFRDKLRDANGNGWVYSWFCMDHVGFTGKNPRKRDPGHHKIFDRYMRMVDTQKKGDIVQFHYHPVSLSGNYNDSGTAYWGNGNLDQILCRKIIDRQWFPVAFRPGFHTERPDSHWFLEQWIPFDYGNQSYREEQDEQLDLSGGRFGDWRRAPLEWHPYHPSFEDYQSKGHCRRWITRCLNMYARMRQIDQKEIDRAFETASSGKDCILSFTDHDYKDMEYEINKVRDMLIDSIKRYPDVKFEFCDAVSAMRKCLYLKHEDINLDIDIVGRQLVVSSKNDIFGSQPYLSIKDKNGGYHWDNLDFAKKNLWNYTFDNNTIPLEQVDVVGVAANNPYGKCEVAVIKDGVRVKNILN